MIPPFDLRTGNLPPGEHRATWSEIEARFGWNDHRVQLLAGLRAALRALGDVGCARAWIDGSFATDKDYPGDFDACWDHAGVDLHRLAGQYPVLLDFSHGRAEQKRAFNGELFLADSSADLAGRVFLDFFQTDRYTGQLKGIILVNPGEVP